MKQQTGHQARKEMFGFNNTTHLCAWTNASPCSQPLTQLFVTLGTSRLVNPNTCLESVYTRSPPYIQGLTVSKWWTIPTLNRKELEMQSIELLWSLSGTHTLYFFRLPCHCRVQQSFNLVNVLISKFFTRQTDRLTD